ncbi:MAG TPA: OmpH family outer membrane protein [Thermoanaerobaculia bacterium]|nr:OmpH family outer membrane protein [Thermoanaerobaculia bacterium]
MNRIVTYAACVAVAALAAAPAARAQSAPQKIAVIEVQRIIQESAIGKEALARVQRLQQTKQEDLAKRQKELRDLEQKIQEQGKSLSEDAMEKLQKDYQARAVDLKRFQDDAQRDLEDAQRKELKTLEERIMPVIDVVAREMGYTLIFNKFQSGLLFAAEDADITNSVITRFNTQIAAPAAKRPAAPPPAPKPAAPAPPPAPKKN